MIRASFYFVVFAMFCAIVNCLVVMVLLARIALADAPCYPPCGMGSTMTGPATNPCPCPDDGINLILELPMDRFGTSTLMTREKDGPDEHCWAVNCRKKDPACPENTCTADIPGNGLLTCNAIYFAPCEQVCDTFCARGVLKPVEEPAR